MAVYNYNPKHKGAINTTGRVVNTTPSIPGKLGVKPKKQGFFSKASFALDKAARKGGKAALKGVRKLPAGIKAGVKTQDAFKTTYYNRRKLSLERKENVIKHRANITGTRTQIAQNKADYLEAKHKQYQIRQQAKLERRLNSNSTSGGIPRHDLYGKTSRTPQKLKKQPGFFD